MNWVWKSSNGFTKFNKYAVSNICAFSIAEHGKGKVDDVGGLPKTTILKAITKSEFFETQLPWLIFLNKSTRTKQTQTYVLKSDSHFPKKIVLFASLKAL